MALLWQVAPLCGVIFYKCQSVILVWLHPVVIAECFDVVMTKRVD